jgi:predicted  nucleic acid-binding Zn-ribbon protein
MAWFANHYSCDRCGEDWVDEWSCMCDDDCPECGSRHYSPFDSEDLTEIIVPLGGEFVVLVSPDTAEHDPNYKEIGRFPTREGAAAFLAEYDPDEFVVFPKDAPRLGDA